MSKPHPDLETKWRHLADPLPAPRPGDWLAEHEELGQSFAEYVDARPVRKSDKLNTIYFCLVGYFTEAQWNCDRDENWEADFPELPTQRVPRRLY